MISLYHDTIIKFELLVVVVVVVVAATITVTDLPHNELQLILIH
jgi:hypothetical protein